MSEWRNHTLPIDEKPKSDWRQHTMPIDGEVKKYDYKLESAPQEQQDGILDTLAQNLTDREMKLRYAQQVQERGGQTGLETGLQAAGQGAGALFDVGAAGMSGLGKLAEMAYDVAPEGLQNYLNVAQQFEQLGQSAPAQAALGAIQSGAERYGEFAKQNPRAARNVEALANISMIGAPATKRAASIKRIGGNIYKGAKQRFVRPEKLTADDLRRVGGQLFKEAERKNAIVMPKVSAQYFDDVDNMLTQTKFGTATKGENEVAKMQERWKAAKLRDEPMTFTGAKELDEELGAKIYSPVGRNIDGTFTAEGKQLLEIQRKLRDMIDNAQPTDFVGGKEAFEIAKEARNYWATSLRLRDIERILETADTFQVPANAIKTGFRQIVRNQKRLSQYTKAEQAAIRSAAKTGLATDILNVAGSRLGSIAGGAAGYGAGGGLGAVAGAAGMHAAGGLSRMAAQSLQAKKAQFVKDLILKRVQKGGNPDIDLTPEMTKLLGEAGIVVAPGATAQTALQAIEELNQQEQQ